MFFIYTYKYPIHIGLLGVLLETNLREATEFFSGYKIILIAIIFLVVVYSTIYIILIKKMCKQVNIKILWIFSIFSFLYLIITFFISNPKNMKLAPLTDNNIVTMQDRLKILQKRVLKSYPYGITLNIVQYINNAIYLRKHHDLMKNTVIHSYRNTTIEEKEIYIFIIGESARYDHFSINGYFRNTSPRLQTREGLINFTNVCSPAPNTHLAIPLLLLNSSPQDFNTIYDKPSVITYFKKLGFQTYWISNYTEFNKLDTPITVIANEADSVIYLSNLQHKDEEDEESQYRYDEDILPVISKILSESASDKLFIVLQTMGSHYRYDLRYPPQFDIFKPSMRGRKDLRLYDISSKEIKINSYDNSIVYTDYFIDLVIDKLSSYKNIIGSVIYISDHGQDLFDDERNLFFHANKEITRHVAHVPMFIWLSNTYKVKFPQKTAAALQNRTKKISGTSIFHTIIDMADITYGGENLTKSIFSFSFQPYKREILTIDHKIIDCNVL